MTEDEEIRLKQALEYLIYEITHLSACEDDGSHTCRVSATALSNARIALSELVTVGGERVENAY